MTHGFFNPQRDDEKWYRATLIAADQFLTEIGYLRGPVPNALHEPFGCPLIQAAARRSQHQ